MLKRYFSNLNHSYIRDNEWYRLFITIQSFNAPVTFPRKRLRHITQYRFASTKINRCLAGKVCQTSQPIDYYVHQVRPADWFVLSSIWRLGAPPMFDMALLNSFPKCDTSSKRKLQGKAVISHTFCFSYESNFNISHLVNDSRILRNLSFYSN